MAAVTGVQLVSCVVSRCYQLSQVVTLLLGYDQLTTGHVEAHGVAGGVGRGAGVVARVTPQRAADGKGADLSSSSSYHYHYHHHHHMEAHRGVRGRHPQLVPSPLCPAHLARGHSDPLEEVDHRVVVVPALEVRWSVSPMNEQME